MQANSAPPAAPPRRRRQFIGRIVRVGASLWPTAAKARGADRPRPEPSLLLSCFVYVVAGALFSVFLCLLGAGLTWLIQGPIIARAFLRYYVLDFDGILVGATTYGLFFLSFKHGKVVLANVSSTLLAAEDDAAELRRLQARATSLPPTVLVSLPITAVGVYVFWNCGFPLSGFAQVYLAVCVDSIWYIASTVLAFMISSFVFFSRVDSLSQPRRTDRVRMDPSSLPVLDDIEDFFTICSVLALLAIYVGFRGALTGFAHPAPNYYDLLILTVVIYLPATLLFALYPRYVLREVFTRDVTLQFKTREEELARLEPHDVKTRLEREKLLYDVKEQALQQGQGSSLLGIKDVPSLAVGLLIVVQFLLDKDSIIRRFFIRE